MTNVFFTADYHLDHGDIIRYCDRPFIHKGDLDESGKWKSDYIKEYRKQEMNTTIVKGHNNVVSNEDIVYHIGDFCFKGVGNAIYWEQQLNGNIVHLRGNHDKNNGVKTYITHAIMEFGGLKFYVSHKPPLAEYSIDECMIDNIESHIVSMCDYILCGHIHNLWKHKYISMWNQSCKINKLCINVGIDVWDYQPVSIHSILKYISRVKK